MVTHATRLDRFSREEAVEAGPRKKANSMVTHVTRLDRFSREEAAEVEVVLGFPRRNGQ